MLNEERRRGILELLQLDGRVLVRDLSDRFHTSLITIRKDLRRQMQSIRIKGSGAPIEKSLAWHSSASNLTACKHFD